MHQRSAVSTPFKESNLDFTAKSEFAVCKAIMLKVVKARRIIELVGQRSVKKSTNKCVSSKSILNTSTLNLNFQN